MRIIKDQSIRQTDRTERQQLTLEAIRELEEQRERGEIEEHAYWIKKRALIKML